MYRLLFDGVAELVTAPVPLDPAASLATIDQVHGGPQGPVKYVDARAIELALRLGGGRYRAWVRRTLTGALGLIDLDGGGCFDYATGNSWDTPCRRKSLRAQANLLRAYALAHADALPGQYPEYLSAMRSLRNFILVTLANGALFRNGMREVCPADISGEYLEARRSRDRKAICDWRLDPATPIQANAWAIQALADMAVATGDCFSRAGALRGLEQLARQAPGCDRLGAALAIGRAAWVAGTQLDEPEFLELAALQLQRIFQNHASANGFRQATTRDDDCLSEELLELATLAQEMLSRTPIAQPLYQRCLQQLSASRRLPTRLPGLGLLLLGDCERGPSVARAVA